MQRRISTIKSNEARKHNVQCQFDMKDVDKKLQQTHEHKLSGNLTNV